MSPERQEYMDGYRKNNAEELRLKAKEYRENNVQKIAQKQREYRENNAQKIAQKHREYRKNKAEEIVQKRREYRENNAEELRLKAKEYRENNAEKLAQKEKEYGEIRKAKRTTTSKRAAKRTHTKRPEELLAPLQKFVLTSDKVAAYLQLGRCYQSIGLADKFDTDAGTMWTIMNSLEYRGVVKTVRGSGPYKLWEKCDIAPVILTTPISTKMPYFGDLDYV